MKLILKSIKEIREINDCYGPGAVGTMRDFSNNITILLRYFKLNGTPNTLDIINSTSLDSQVQALFKEQEDYLKAEELHRTAQVKTMCHYYQPSMIFSISSTF